MVFHDVFVSFFLIVICVFPTLGCHQQGSGGSAIHALVLGHPSTEVSTSNILIAAGNDPGRESRMCASGGGEGPFAPLQGTLHPSVISQDFTVQPAYSAGKYLRVFLEMSWSPVHFSFPLFCFLFRHSSAAEEGILLNPNSKAFPHRWPFHSEASGLLYCTGARVFPSGKRWLCVRMRTNQSGTHSCSDVARKGPLVSVLRFKSCC